MSYLLCIQGLLNMRMAACVARFALQCIPSYSERSEAIIGLGSIEINGGSGIVVMVVVVVGRLKLAPVALHSSSFALNSAQVLYINTILSERLLIPQ